LNIAANAAKKSEKEHTITVAEVEAEDEAILVKKWAFAIQNERL
jgi:hypothetical protein